MHINLVKYWWSLNKSLKIKLTDDEQYQLQYKKQNMFIWMLNLDLSHRAFH